MQHSTNNSDKTNLLPPKEPRSFFSFLSMFNFSNSSPQSKKLSSTKTISPAPVGSNTSDNSSTAVPERNNPSPTKDRATPNNDIISQINKNSRNIHGTQGRPQSRQLSAPSSTGTTLNQSPVGTQKTLKQPRKVTNLAPRNTSPQRTGSNDGLSPKIVAQTGGNVPSDAVRRALSPSPRGDTTNSL